MAILGVGGEVDCFRVNAPDDASPLSIIYNGKELFDRIDVNLGRPGYYLDLPAQGSRNVWVHAMTKLDLGDPGSNSDPGIVFMRDKVALARFRFDKVYPFNCVVETSYNGLDAWTARTIGVDQGYTSYGARQWITWDIHIYFAPSGGVIEVYKDGVLRSSYHGAFMTAYEACNCILFYQNAHYFREIIVADESTVGMRLLTRAIYQYGAPVAFSGGWDRNGWGVSGSDSVLLNSTNFHYDYWWSTGIQNASMIWEPVPIDYAPLEFDPNTLLDGTYEIKAISVAAIVSHIPGGSTKSSRFVLTDGETVSAVSEDLNTFPTATPYYYRAQRTWNLCPFDGLAWSYDTCANLLFGIQAV